MKSMTPSRRKIRQAWQWLKKSWIVMAFIGYGSGTVIGWLVFSVSGLDGVYLAVSLGGLAGAVVATGVHHHRKHRSALVLETVTVSVPHFSEMVFVVNSEYRTVAWKFFVDTMTRVSTQPLDPDGGLLRDALESLYQLFLSTRELVKNFSPTQSSSGTPVELLAIRMLNVEVRPFLTKWHSIIPYDCSDTSEFSEAQSQECRKDLECLRIALLDYSKAFGELARVNQLDRYFKQED